MSSVSTKWTTDEVLDDVILAQESLRCEQKGDSDMDTSNDQAFTNQEGPGFEGFLESIEPPLDTTHIIGVYLFNGKRRA